MGRGSGGSTGKRISFVVDEVGPDIPEGFVMYDAQVYAGDGTFTDDGGVLFARELATFAILSLESLQGVVLLAGESESFHFVAASAQGGPLDIVLSEGNPYTEPRFVLLGEADAEPAARLGLALADGYAALMDAAVMRTVMLQKFMDDGEYRTVATLTMRVETVPEPSTLGIVSLVLPCLVSRWIVGNIRAGVVQNASKIG